MTKSKLRMLTDLEVAAYLAGDGDTCPYCQNVNLDYGVLEAEDGFVYQDVSCLACDRTWTDVYTKTDIQEHED